MVVFTFVIWSIMRCIMDSCVIGLLQMSIAKESKLGPTIERFGTKK
ncbi:hypothetical protein GLYMA_03G036009v4 [Glycine max]|nr:hypothetical protein GLYMA_03G036009v4 [Glycine max]KAH1068501.1 hypothetical protein GYH30_006171 [Glycine max]